MVLNVLHIVYELVKIWLIECQMGTVFHTIHELGTKRGNARLLTKCFLRSLQAEHYT